MIADFLQSTTTKIFLFSFVPQQLSGLSIALTDVADVLSLILHFATIRAQRYTYLQKEKKHCFLLIEE